MKTLAAASVRRRRCFARYRAQRSRGRSESSDALRAPRRRCELSVRQPARPRRWPAAGGRRDFGAPPTTSSGPTTATSRPGGLVGRACRRTAAREPRPPAPSASARAGWSAARAASARRRSHLAAPRSSPGRGRRAEIRRMRFLSGLSRQHGAHVPPIGLPGSLLSPVPRHAAAERGREHRSPALRQAPSSSFF